MIKAILFDLDGTLLPMDEEVFTKAYFSLLCQKVAPYGYEPKQLISTIWAGTKQMMKNDGSKSNEQAFWEVFAQNYGEERMKDKELFDSFYAHEFTQTKAVCEENPLAKEIVRYAREKFGRVVLSTNPIFPKVGTLTRMGFIGLTEEDFDLVTTYENSRFCKPNPAYFQDILQRFSLSPNEVILFGNNESEDGDCAYRCGIRCYLVGDHVIKNEKKLTEYERIPMNKVIETMNKYL